MRITKKRLELTAEHLKMKHEAREEAIRQRLEGIARHMSWWDKIKLFIKV